MGAIESRESIDSRLSPGARAHRDGLRLSELLNPRSCSVNDAYPSPGERKKEEAGVEREEQDIVEAMRGDLREKYLNDIETLHRRVAGDPEAWSVDSLEETGKKIQRLTEMLAAVDSLELAAEGAQALPKGLQEEGETCCPICFEDFLPPRMIFSCRNGHSLCSECLDKLSAGMHKCSECREDFWVTPPRRNFLAEKLVLKLKEK